MRIALGIHTNFGVTFMLMKILGILWAATAKSKNNIDKESHTSN